MRLFRVVDIVSILLLLIVMSYIRIKSIAIQNYRSFWERQNFLFPDENYKKPISIIWYNNSWKTNLMNCILYWLNVNFVSKETFCIDDFHNRNIENIPKFLLHVDSSTERKYDWKDASLKWFHNLVINVDEDEILWSKIQSLNSLQKVQKYNGWPYVDDDNFQAFWANKYFNIFYVNFHNIKDEIQTWKTSWGNLKSFLSKHIKKITDIDTVLLDKKEDFKNSIDSATNNILDWSKMQEFINSIQKNYNKNLRDKVCKVEFWLPEYEDIFLQMMFKIGLNWDSENLVPISHFWDGYISMFVMAVIQAIAETNSEDKCLFLLEEPESFLHENHQEYFYKQVLCSLAESGHQVIYTTHSDKMIDIFDTKSIIRLEMDENNQTIKKYNEIWEFEITESPVSIETYNQYIKSIEPNLNRILFSKKVILVEWPNDLMVYKFVIEKEVEKMIQYDNSIENKKRFAETYLNFKNISIIPHHGKHTVHLLIKLCNHFKIDYFVINDFDIEEDLVESLCQYETLAEMKWWDEYQNVEYDKWILTTNFKIIKATKENQFHFNISKLERVIWYEYDDKNSFKIWDLLQSRDFWDNLFPQNLKSFLEFSNLMQNQSNMPNTRQNPDDILLEDLPF